MLVALLATGCGGSQDEPPPRKPQRDATSEPADQLQGRKAILAELKRQLEAQNVEARASGDVLHPDELTNRGSAQAASADYTCNVFESGSDELTAFEDAGSFVKPVRDASWSIACGVVEIDPDSQLREKVEAAVSATNRELGQE